MRETHTHTHIHTNDETIGGFLRGNPPKTFIIDKNGDFKPKWV